MFITIDDLTAITAMLKFFPCNKATSRQIF